MLCKEKFLHGSLKPTFLGCLPAKLKDEPFAHGKTVLLARRQLLTTAF